MDGTGANLRRSTPRSATLHCNRSAVSQVSSRLIPGYIRCTEYITCFHVLDLWVFHNSWILSIAQMDHLYSLRLTWYSKKGTIEFPPFAPMQRFAKHWIGISKVEVIHCTWNSSVQEAEQHDWSWSIKARKITGGKVQGVSPRGERVGCLSKDVGKIHVLEKLKVIWYLNVWSDILCSKRDISNSHRKTLAH